MSLSTDRPSVWDGVVGQDAAVKRLLALAEHPPHAYLFVGPEGAGKEIAARAFAARLITGSSDASSREADLIMRGAFADVTEVVREGAAVDKEEAQTIVQQSVLTPTESSMRVVIIHDVHLMRDTAAVRLLKTLEEPNERLVFILLAEQLVTSLDTINSRCVIVQFPPMSADSVVEALVAEGIGRDVARRAALSSGGSLGRARVLVADPALASRQEFFASIPYRLDGSGATVARLVDELDDMLETAIEPLAAQHERELEELEMRVKLSGERGSGRRALADSHKRQLRKFKTDELREGLALVAAEYHHAVVTLLDSVGIGEYERAILAIHDAIGALAVNVNETLLLHSLFARCPSLRTVVTPRSLLATN
jgi:DNA polymerase-3 subunit delta'